MSNELTVCEPEKFPALIDGSDLREAILANTRGEGFSESDLVRVPTPAGGSTRWVVPTVMGEEVTEELAGILVYFAHRGVLWPSFEVSGGLPLLVSNDLVSARRVGDTYGDIDPDELEKYSNGDGTYDWRNLPWNRWGTGKNGTGKRCKESRLLMLLREGEAFPLLVRAQPGSLTTVRPFIIRLPVPHYRAVVGLKLQVAESKGAGAKYSQIVPRLVSILDKDAGAKVKSLYTDLLAKLAESATLDGDED